MARPAKYAAGDFVFAKVKGYPPWPARITACKSASLYKVFWYGTYEHANALKRDCIWPYNDENIEKFGSKNEHRPGYAQGLWEIVNTPEMAPDTEEDASLVSEKTPLSASKGKAKTTTPSSSRGTKRKINDSPMATEDPQSEHEERTGRGGRMIKSKKLDDGILKSPRGGPKKVAVVNPIKIESKDKAKKVWIKVKSTGEFIELNLNDEPKFESNEQKLECERSLVSEAFEFLQLIESGKFEEIQKLKKKKNQLSPYEKELLDILGVGEKAALEKEKRLKVLRIEKRIVDLDIVMKQTLLSETPDLEDCMNALEELNNLPLTPLMIKKLDQVFTSIRWLRKYAGPKGFLDWQDKTEKENMDKKVKAIQQKADQVYKKIVDLFFFKEKADKPFGEEFEKLVKDFKQKISGMGEKQILCLIKDPTLV